MDCYNPIAVSTTCPEHPNRTSVGTCTKCAGPVCPLCMLEVDGSNYCSLKCFVEQATTKRSKGAAPRATPAPTPAPPASEEARHQKTDPLAEMDLGAKDYSEYDDLKDSLDESSVVLDPAQADPESSIMTSPLIDNSDTSILDLKELKKAEEAPAEKQVSEPSAEDISGSAVRRMSSLADEGTSILGVDAIPMRPNLPVPVQDPGAGIAPEEAEPVDPPPRRRAKLTDKPTNDTPLLMVLPGTRRSTLSVQCIHHPDTSASVLCSKCGDPICTLCIEDEEHGGRCTPYCRRDREARRSRRTVVVAAVAVTAAAAAGILVWIGRPHSMVPGAVPPVVRSPQPEAPRSQVPQPIAMTPLPPKAAPIAPEPEKPAVSKIEPPKTALPALPPRKAEAPPSPPPLAHRRTWESDPWGHEPLGRWYRVKTTSNGQESFKDVGLKEIGPGYRILVTQSFAGGKVSPEEFHWTEPERATISASVNLDIQGTRYGVDVVSSPPPEPSRYLFVDGPHRGITFPSDGTAVRLSHETLRVQNRSFLCSVLELSFKAPKPQMTVWTAPGVPIGALRTESGGTSTALVELGDDWSKRPLFPGAPAPVKAEPVRPPAPTPAPVITKTPTPLVEAPKPVLTPPAPPKVDPPKAEAPKPLPPAPELAKPEPPKALAAKTEPPKSTPATPEPQPVAPVVPEVPAPLPTLELKLKSAGMCIREATPLFCQIADQMGQGASTNEAAVSLISRISYVSHQLQGAQEIYASLLDQVPDRILLERRLATLQELISALSQGKEHLKAIERVP